MGMMSDMEHEDYGPKRRAAEKAIGQTRDFLAEQVQDPTNYLPAVGKLGKLTFGAAMALKNTDANAMFFGGSFLPKKLISQLDTALEAGHVTKEELFKKYGLFKDPRGEWRAYKPDVNVTMDSARYLKGGQGKLGEYLIHPDLYKVRPDLANVKTARTAEMEGTGDYDPFFKKIRFSDRLYPDQAIPTLTHELQHHIQTQGGVSNGANPDQFTGPKMSKKEAEKRYMNNPGEVEARVAAKLIYKDLLKSDTGLAELFNLFGKEISEPLFYFDTTVR